MRNRLCERFGLEFPIYAFSHCRDVVAAVSKAGGFGVLGALYFTPDELEVELDWIDKHVDGKPYGVDLVMPASSAAKRVDDHGEVEQLFSSLEEMIPDDHRRFVDELLAKHGVPQWPSDEPPPRSLLGWTDTTARPQLEVAMAHPISLLVNALGPPPMDVVDLAHDAGVAVAALIGRTDQALAQQAQGVDIIVAQGTEAGGHTGDVSTLVLVPEVVDAVGPETPVLAAGGIGTGRQMAAAMALGADGVWTGSIWLTTAESDVTPAVRDKLLAAGSRDTVRSRALTGKPARQLRTAWTEAWDDPANPDPLPMPLQYMLVADAQSRIGRFQNKELAGFPVGQIVGRMNDVRPVRDVIHQLVDEYIDATERLHADLEG